MGTQRAEAKRKMGSRRVDSEAKRTMGTRRAQAKRKMGTRRAESIRGPVEANKTEVLQQDLWDRLPFDLIELVLHKIPFSRLLPFCYVCKKWGEFILSTRRHSLFLYDSNELVVRNLNFGATGVWERLSLEFMGQFKSSHFFGSSGGLVGFCDIDEREGYYREFIICNPLTRRFKRVPLPRALTVDVAAKPDRPKLDFMNPTMGGMFTNRGGNNTGHFKLVLLALTEEPTIRAVGFVYCSCDDSWKRVELPEALQPYFAKFGFGEWRIQNTPTEHLGSMYWWFSIIYEDEKCECFIVKYNVELNQWTWINSKNPDCQGYGHAIIPSNGNLFFFHGEGDSCQQSRESHSSHELTLESAPTTPSGHRTFLENMVTVMKFVTRIDEAYIVVTCDDAIAEVLFPGGAILQARMKYYGDGGPVLYCVGLVHALGNYDDEAMVKTLGPDKGEKWERLIVGIEDMSRLVISDWEKWPKGAIVHNCWNGGILSPTL